MANNNNILNKRGLSLKDGEAASGVSRFSKGSRVSKKSLTTSELRKFFESNKNEVEGDAKSRFSQLSKGQVSKFRLRMKQKIEEAHEMNAAD